MSGPARQQSHRPPAPYIKRAVLLTAGERRFFHEGLNPAISGRYLVSFKVRLADVITVEEWQSTHGRKIAQKHIDFVLITPNATRIVAAIELNDATHDSTDRKKRDAFIGCALASARVPLVTFPIYQRYDPTKIRRQIFTAIAKTRTARRSANDG